MLTYLSIIVFLFGLAVGSFLNVVILRYKRKDLSGRSECPHCGKKLEWFELIPLLSFFFQGFKCRSCKEPISWQYPLVELFSGLAFFGIFLFLLEERGVNSIFTDLLFWASFAILGAIWSFLVAIFVYDLYHKIIPDRFVYPFIFLSFIWLLLSGGGKGFLVFPDLLDIFAGPLLFLFFFSLWYFSRGTWMGFGDAKLALGMGFLLGFSKGFSAFMLSFWIGAVVSLIFLLLKPQIINIIGKRISSLKDISIKSEIPFAPFLIIGTALAFFFGLDMAALLNLFYF